MYLGTVDTMVKKTKSQLWGHFTEESMKENKAGGIIVEIMRSGNNHPEVFFGLRYTSSAWSGE